MRLLRFTLLALLLGTGTASADAFGITVLNASYRTDLSARIFAADYSQHPLVVKTQTQYESTVTSDAPLSQALRPSAKTSALATADLFAVSTSTDAYAVYNNNETSAYSAALAQTVLHFSPVQSGIANLSLDVVLGHQTNFTGGLLSLLDLTTNTSLWSYGWQRGFQGNMPSWSWYGGSLVLDQSLLASHQYVLTLLAVSDANTDSQRNNVRIGGLQAVPEPGTLSLMALGLGWAFVRGRRNRQRP